MQADLKKLLNKLTNWVNDHNHSGYGTAVSINSYSSSSNAYTVPSDGLVVASCNYRQGQYVQIFVDGVLMAQGSSGASNAGSVIVPIPVFKGQQVYCVINTTAYSSASFYPFT